MREKVLTNATVVTRDQTFTGTVCFDAQGIRAVEPGNSTLPGAEDCAGEVLVAGLIEMHTDNVERHMEPRPGVVWPSSIGALTAHDAQMASAGITTVLDAISVGDYTDGGQRRAMLSRTVAGLKHGREHDLFRAEHFMHMRCEVSDPGVVDMFEPYAADPIVRLVSVMDHTPGQRQWRDLAKMRQFHSRRRSYTDAEFADFISERQRQQALHATTNRKRVLALWAPRGLPTASHDDTTAEHIAEARRDGITIAEFPTTAEAARLARDGGMATIMGAPNLVRGGSHSGNVSAAELAGSQLLDALSSDYVPVSLLHGALLLAEGHGFSLPAALATVTCNVADLLGFDDRGELCAGKRADLVRVRRLGDGNGVVRAVWREGRRVS